jgi:hypothetical protein
VSDKKYRHRTEALRIKPNRKSKEETNGRKMWKEEKDKEKEKEEKSDEASSLTKQRLAYATTEEFGKTDVNRVICQNRHIFIQIYLK